LKKADITIVREYESGLPHVNAIGNELNQVWTNLIDNAIDSIGSHGTHSQGNTTPYFRTILHNQTTW
jgi:nitrogen-specific signal transduction histidine kinase